MIFLIEYERSKGELVTFRNFDDSQRQVAADRRLALELELNRCSVDHEVVLLEADSEAALRRTHGRYFYNLRELLKAAGGNEGTGEEVDCSMDKPRNLAKSVTVE